ncbi:hypothetical protein BOX15_Mlig015553g2, partial [Macrostomum lignano]
SAIEEQTDAQLSLTPKPGPANTSRPLMLGTPNRPSPLDRLKDSSRELHALLQSNSNSSDQEQAAGGCDDEERCLMSSSLLDLDEFSAADNCYGVSFNAAASASRLTLHQKFQQQQQLNLNASLNDSLSRSYAFCNFLNRSSSGFSSASRGQQQSLRQLCDQARSPAKAICTIDRRTTRILTANTVFGQLFNDCQTEALIGRRLLSLIGRRGGGESSVASVPETAIDVAGEAVPLNGKLFECRSTGQPVSVWAKSVSPSDASALVILEPVHCVVACLTADSDGIVTSPPTGPAARLLPPDTTGRPLFNLLPGCRPPPKGETSATFAASVLAAGCDHPCSVRVDRSEPGSLIATLTFYCNMSGLMTVAEDAADDGESALTVHSVHPLLAKLLLGQSAKRLVGEPIDSVLPGFSARHCPALVAAGSGSYTGEALHSSGTAVPVAYHLKRIELTGGRRLLCVWLSRQGDDWPEQAASISDDGCDDGEGIEDSIQRASKPVDEGEASIISKSPQAAAAEVNESVASTDAAATAQSPDDEAEAEAEAENELSSRYEVTLHLGRGAYGYVKAAVRRSDGAQVVVKFVRKSKLAAHQLMERPESLGGGLVPREAAILQSVSHLNIVPLLDALESRRYYELVMPRHGLGMDLFEFIDRNPSLDEPLASYMFRQMASAVAYLHSRGIAHRDLKDENVILDERFCLMLIDFGAAAFVSPDRPFSVFCGTMEYCAPEILQGHPYFGPEADVWSLGVTLYTLVFGENPFFDVDETLAGVLKPQWKPSPQLSRLLRVMLQVDPKLRAGICEVERHPWTTQPVNIDCYNFEDVLPNCQFAGNVGSDYRQNSDEAA